MCGKAVPQWEDIIISVVAVYYYDLGAVVQCLGRSSITSAVLKVKFQKLSNFCFTPLAELSQLYLHT